MAKSVWQKLQAEMQVYNKGFVVSAMTGLLVAHGSTADTDVLFCDMRLFLTVHFRMLHSTCLVAIKHKFQSN